MHTCRFLRKEYKQNLCLQAVGSLEEHVCLKKAKLGGRKRKRGVVCIIYSQLYVAFNWTREELRLFMTLYIYI